jgi:two-component system, NtrC family, sensor kinase
MAMGRGRHDMKELLSDESLEANRLASLGQLVDGIAHEIKTPISAIHSMHGTLAAALEKLKRSLGPDQSRQTTSALQAMEQAIQVIELGSSRTLELVKHIRGYARGGDNRRPADLHAELEDTLLLLQHELKSRIQVRKSFGAIPPVVCNTSRINQVFLNVLLNAIQAIPREGTISITTDVQDDQVRIIVQDDGAGIDSNNLPQVFETGFTTKQAAGGSGIGLAVCRQIVTDHHGRIDLQSEAGRGTTVTISLPTTELPDDPG